MNILFMCVANSARSQLAETLAKSIFQERARIESAGSAPKFVHPLGIQVLEEVGLSTIGKTSKSLMDLDPEFLKRVRFLITLCDDEVCPITSLPGAERLHWPFPDPANPKLSTEQQLQLFRDVRNRIHDRLVQFADEIKRS